MAISRTREITGRPRGRRAPVRLERERVLVRARDAVLHGNVLGRLAHRKQLEAGGHLGVRVAPADGRSFALGAMKAIEVPASDAGALVTTGACEGAPEGACSGACGGARRSGSRSFARGAGERLVGKGSAGPPGATNAITVYFALLAPSARRSIVRSPQCDTTKPWLDE